MLVTAFLLFASDRLHQIDFPSMLPLMGLTEFFWTKIRNCLNMFVFAEQVCLFVYCCDLRFIDHIFENALSDCN